MNMYQLSILSPYLHLLAYLNINKEISIKCDMLNYAYSYLSTTYNWAQNMNSNTNLIQFTGKVMKAVATCSLHTPQFYQRSNPGCTISHKPLAYYKITRKIIAWLTGLNVQNSMLANGITMCLLIWIYNTHNYSYIYYKYMILLLICVTRCSNVV